MQSYGEAMRLYSLDPYRYPLNGYGNLKPRFALLLRPGL